MHSGVKGIVVRCVKRLFSNYEFTIIDDIIYLKGQKIHQYKEEKFFALVRGIERSIFISECRKKFGDTYIYNYDSYTNRKGNIEFKCPIHGGVSTNAHNHLHNKGGCPKCGNSHCGDHLKSSTEEFIKKCKKVHPNKFTYSKVEYKNNREKVIITCKKHGDFLVTPSNILSGKGCPKCVNYKYSVSESKIVSIITQTFSNELILTHHSPEGLKRQHFDVYFPDYNIAVEYDGQQHFRPSTLFGGIKEFEKTLIRDKTKNDLARENKCRLFRIPYNYNDEYLNNVISQIKFAIENYGNS